MSYIAIKIVQYGILESDVMIYFVSSKHEEGSKADSLQILEHPMYNYRSREVLLIVNL